MYFQLKVNKSERCHNLGPGRTLREIFAATAHLEALFRVISIFCLHRALLFTSWKLFAYGKIFAHGKIKSGRKSLVK